LNVPCATELFIICYVFVTSALSTTKNTAVPPGDNKLFHWRQFVDLIVFVTNKFFIKFTKLIIYDFLMFQNVRINRIFIVLNGIHSMAVLVLAKKPTM